MTNKTIGGCIWTPCPDAFLQVQPLNQEPLVCWKSRVHPSNINVAHLIREVTTETTLGWIHWGNFIFWLFLKVAGTFGILGNPLSVLSFTVSDASSPFQTSISIPCSSQLSPVVTLQINDSRLPSHENTSFPICNITTTICQFHLLNKHWIY